MSKKPDFLAYGEVDLGRRQPVLIKIGATWLHEKGKGFTTQVDALPLNFNGRIVNLEPRADETSDGSERTEGGDE